MKAQGVDCLSAGNVETDIQHGTFIAKEKVSVFYGAGDEARLHVRPQNGRT